MRAELSCSWTRFSRWHVSSAAADLRWHRPNPARVCIFWVRRTRHPCRAGWFNKCQVLSYIVLTYGGGNDAAQEAAALFYAGPEQLEPTYEDDEAVIARREEYEDATVDDEEEEDEGELHLACTTSSWRAAAHHEVHTHGTG